MATFAAKMKDDDEEEGKPEEKEKDVLGIIKTGPKKLTTSESSSMYKLKNEFLLRKDRVATQFKPSGSHVAGKSNLLAPKKEEKERLAREANDRKSRISNLERELKREEEEKMEKSKQKMREKAELYERMAEGSVVRAGRNDAPVDFLVDFQSIKRRREEERDAERERHREIEEATPTGFGRAPIPDLYNHNEEQRVYGTSHMRLSQNANKRKEEIDNLLEMSKKTDEEKKKRREIQEKREKERREKINRMRIKNGLEPLAEPTPPPPVDLDSIPIPAPQETPEQRHERLMKSDREWDRGKGLYTTWIEKERDDRDDEFRPPDSYFR